MSTIQDDKKLTLFGRAIEFAKTESDPVMAYLAGAESGSSKWDKSLLKELISMAEDGVKLYRKNAVHQEFISEDLEVLKKAKELLNDETLSPSVNDRIEKLEAALRELKNYQISPTFERIIDKALSRP